MIKYDDWKNWKKLRKISKVSLLGIYCAGLNVV